MTDAVLALNAGSSSFKFALAPMVDVARKTLSGSVERIGSENSVLNLKKSSGERVTKDLGSADHRSALTALFDVIGEGDPTLKIQGVGHRIVHGGERFKDPVKVDETVFDEIDALTPLAPLHQPHGLRGIRTSMDAFPKAINVACFDTAFHADKPWVHNSYALPRRHYDEGVRRYGFHGLACASICATLESEGFPLADRKIVIAHLGNGCSVSAIKNGRSNANSMGFSTLDGLTMGTRCGGIDSGVLLHFMRAGLGYADIEHTLYHESGLLGLSGVSNDMRDLFETNTRECQEAVTFFVARLAEEVGRMACTMGGLDTLVFSGGIGENAASIRDAVAERLAFLPGYDGNGVQSIVKPADEEHQLLAAARRMKLATCQ